MNDWRLCALLLLAAGAFYQPVEYDNTKSRLILLSSIVDQGTLSIDPQRQYTLDKAEARGHYYSNKAIGAPLLAVPVYWALRHTVLKPVSTLPDPTILADPVAKYLVRLIVVSLPFALFGVFLRRFLVRAGAAPKQALAAVLAYGLGSIALNHASLFSGHELAGIFCFLSFALIAQGGSGFAAGLGAGLGALCDYTGLFTALILLAYALVRLPSRRSKGGFLQGAALCAILQGAYNHICFGHFWSFPYSHLEQGPFGPQVARGLFGVTLPRWEILRALLFSPSRGLLFVSPIFLYSIMGLVHFWRRRDLRSEFWTCGAIIAGTLLLNASYFGWHGGWTYGPRYLVGALPFLCLPLALAVDISPCFWALAGLSFLQVSCAQIALPHAPQEIRNPIIELFIPLWKYGYGAATPFGSANWGAILILGSCSALGVFLVNREKGGAIMESHPFFRKICWSWAGLILLSLATLRSPDPKAVHRYRGILLYDGALCLRSVPILRAAERELALAGGSSPAAP
ncbi:MAG: hypothetical protein HY921_00875 [Elusimicrobia bacterium]|nr:hypothetical protein [Elusimicrobiota bacterium]